MQPCCELIMKQFVQTGNSCSLQKVNSHTSRSCSLCSFCHRSCFVCASSSSRAFFSNASVFFSPYRCIHQNIIAKYITIYQLNECNQGMYSTYIMSIWCMHAPVCLHVCTHIHNYTMHADAYTYMHYTHFLSCLKHSTYNQAIPAALHFSLLILQVHHTVCQSCPTITKMHTHIPVLYCKCQPMCHAHPVVKHSIHLAYNTIMAHCYSNVYNV